MIIPCPFCGDRDEAEFDYGGPRLDYPALDATPDSWHQALYLRSHPQAVIVENWFHRYGCERWIHVTRDTGTHCISDSST